MGYMYMFIQTYFFFITHQCHHSRHWPENQESFGVQCFLKYTLTCGLEKLSIESPIAINRKPVLPAESLFIHLQSFL